MQFIQLGKSGLVVSRVCLGTAFRAELDEATCIAAIDRAVQLGCNFIDSANFYRDGYSEQIVGKAIRGRRDELIVTTKVGSQLPSDPSSGGLSRQSILTAAEQSLKRLATDYIDLYLCHFPDPAIATEETFGALNDLVRQGKVRYVGVSNYESWRLYETLDVCGENDWAMPVCNQVSYNVIERRIEHELLPFCRQRNVGVTVYAATAIGLLSGRYRYGQPPPVGSTWWRGPYNFRIAMTPQVDRVVQTLIEMAESRDTTPSQIAMAWCLAQPGISSVITGADTPERVAENMSAADLVLSDDELRHLEDITCGIRWVMRKDCPQGYTHSSAADPGATG